MDDSFAETVKNQAKMNDAANVRMHKLLKDTDECAKQLQQDLNQLQKQRIDNLLQLNKLLQEKYKYNTKQLQPQTCKVNENSNHLVELFSLFKRRNIMSAALFNDPNHQSLEFIYIYTTIN